MRNPALSDSDGLAKLLSAVRVAANGLPGVAVAMDNMVHAPRLVHKVHTSSIAALRFELVMPGSITKS
jgi:L-asparaginase/Glu-tRNA(Gln) amidotransferase subunit D